jgi:S-methylmethionine-dependent homocysteine/selenocysteine methylase/SAM-dependent methyltransferase
VAYERIESAIEMEHCVLLDGAMGTELPQVGQPGAALDERLWGTRALIDSPEAVLKVHRGYVAARCDVISTNTWGLAAALAGNGPRLWEETGTPVHWMDIARRAVVLARESISEADREGECAVAFSLNADLDSREGRGMIPLLGRLFADEPSDLILLETLSLLGPSLEETVDDLLGLGLPIWLSFRRCRHGVCGVYGEHWGGPEGDAFGRAARRFEEMGVGALLVNCIPPDHVDGIVSYLRDFTDLPLGVYPNLGYLTDQGWRFEPGVGGEAYADMALRWREEGAQIVGGCCGSRPEHMAAAREALEVTKPGRVRRTPRDHRNGRGATTIAVSGIPAAWEDRRARRLYPLPFPELTVDPGVTLPNEASLMAWRYLHREGVGAHQRCLDVGSGTGIQGIQLALNGAAHVHAIDIDRRAVANTLTNAFRNGVEGRLTAGTVDIYPWVPEERYEVIVAALHQQPTDPAQAQSSHRVADYWGRNLVDQLIAKLPEALAPEGVAYILQLSILSQQRTAALIEASGFDAEVVDYALFGFSPEHQASGEQIARVEGLSDAYHLRVGERDVMVAYLLEVTAKNSEARTGFPLGEQDGEHAPARPTGAGR